MTRPESIVIDTNVVLDWLVFRDAGVAPALDARTACWRWLACAAMRDEFVEVLRRGLAERTGVSIETALLGWGQATLLPAPAAATPLGHWRCRDADDQKFIDLALEQGARWLLTRDHDVLALAGRARQRGLDIVTPARWVATTR